jgi:hypothetical protein
MKIILFGLLFCSINNILIAQRNSFRYQTGLAHCFFDGTPVVNGKDWYEFDETKYLNKSYGFQFQRILDNGTRLQIDMLSYNHQYGTFNFEKLPATPDSILYPMLTFFSRKYFDIQFCFLRNKSINRSFSYQFGIGPTFRFATYQYTPPATVQPGPGPIILNYPSTIHPFDIGANTRAEISYSPVKWLTLFSQVNLVGLFFRFEDPFFESSPLFKANKPLQLNFPSRFDLSLRVGVGINF